jgi:Concanavalin A-like lectin/glucanases superfamily
MDTQMHPVHFTSTVILLLGLLWAPGFAQPRVDRSAPSAQGLVGWWRVLPGLSGGPRWYDLMGRFPATLTNMTTTGSGWAATTRPGGDGEMRFDGINDNVQTPANSAIMPPYYTMLVWIRSRGAWPGSYALIWEAVGGGANLFLNAGHLATYSAGSIDPAPTSLALDTWYQLGLVMTTTQQQLYIDCRLDAQTAISGPMAANPFSHVFGAKLDLTNPLSGSMDDMKFYRRGLSASEICAARRQSQRGDPQLLPPALLGLLAQVLRTPSAFFPFFSP